MKETNSTYSTSVAGRGRQPVLLATAFAGLAAGSLLAFPVQADTTLTVDLGTTLRPATRVASGSLYGVTENLPADIDALIAPLRPNMFTNPAENVQQPRGDAILVAERLAPIGARVTIRLADWLPGWPYQFTNMTDWLDKVGQTVARKQGSGLDNYYGYEIWNEPGGTWTSSIPFNDFWKQTYDELRRLDPTANIIGPSYSCYNSGSLRSFLTFARDNNCVPDIVAWHEWGGNPGGNIQAYRNMEQELGIGPLLISINEYSGEERIDDEGQPGASAPMIAKFERFGVDTACISYWDVAHAGRLGSLLATDTQPNGGWWFYKWYGDMTGNMVATQPPSANDVVALDGFANLDEEARFASVLFAGVNDGAIRIVVEGFDSVPFFGSTVHAVVERTPWVNRTTVVDATETLSTDDIPIANGQIEVSIPNANDVDGFRVYLTPLDAGSGGTGGNGGTAGAETGGSGPTGGMATGGIATGGAAMGGAVTGGAVTGGVPTGGLATGGLVATGGASTGGFATGGMVTTGGASPAGTGGAFASGGSLVAGAPSVGTTSSDANDKEGCGCQVPGRPQSPPWMLGLALLGMAAACRHRSASRTGEVCG